MMTLISRKLELAPSAELGGSFLRAAARISSWSQMAVLPHPCLGASPQQFLQQVGGGGVTGHLSSASPSGSSSKPPPCLLLPVLLSEH